MNIKADNYSPDLTFVITTIDRYDFCIRLLRFLVHSSSLFPVVLVAPRSIIARLKPTLVLLSSPFSITIVDSGDTVSNLSDLYRRLALGALRSRTKYISWLPIDDIPLLDNYKVALEQLMSNKSVLAAYGSLIDFIMIDDNKFSGAGSDSLPNKQSLCGHPHLTGKIFPTYDMQEDTPLERIFRFNCSRHNFALVYGVYEAGLFIQCVSACARAKFNSWRWSDRLHIWVAITSSVIIRVPPLILHQADGSNTGGFQMISKEPTDIHWLESPEFSASLAVFKSELLAFSPALHSPNLIELLLSISI